MSGLWYDAVSNRWTIGSRSNPRMHIPDNNVGVLAGMRFYSGTLPALTIGSLGGLSIATMSCVGAKENDLVLVQSQTNLTLSIVGARVPSGGDQVWIEFANVRGASVQQPVARYDVLAITFQS